jgi:hypothetical protein
MGGACSTNGERRNAYRLLVGKPEGRRPLGRPRRKCLDNIRTDLVEVEWGGVDWIGLAEDRDRWRTFANSVLNLRIPYNAERLSSVQTTRDLSSSAQLLGVSYNMQAFSPIYDSRNSLTVVLTATIVAVQQLSYSIC